MTLSALALTAQGPTLDTGYRVRRGFTNLIWERVFGTNAVATIPTGVACTTVAQVFDPAVGGFWPYFPEGFPLWQAVRKTGNAEMQEYRDNLNKVPAFQAVYGAPHSMGTDYFTMHARVAPSITTDAQVTSSYTENTDTGVLHNLNSGQTITCEIPAGLSGFAVGQKLIIGNRHAASGPPSRGCYATTVSYSGTTLVATSNGAPNNMQTGSYFQLYIIQRNFEAGMAITRYNGPAQIEGYWELEFQASSGAGHWDAIWFIEETRWPPEVDLYEKFDIADGDNKRVHAAFIASVDNAVITQVTKTYQNWCLNDDVGQPKDMAWGADHSAQFQKIGLEWGPNFLAYTLSDTLARAEFYKWISLRGASVGQVSFQPRLALNYALGPPISSYRPLTVNKFPGSFSIKYARFYTR